MKLLWKLFMTSKWTTAKFSLRQTMFIWRTRNVRCLELIPAELEAVLEAVYDIQANTKRFFIKADHVRLNNKECIMSWINTCWTWTCFRNCLWHQSGKQQSFIQGEHVPLENKECVMNWINTCWTWISCVNCWWCLSSRVRNYFSGKPCSFEEIRMYDILNQYLLVFFRKGSVRNQPRFKKWHLRMKQ